MNRQEIEIRRDTRLALPTVRDTAIVTFRHWRGMVVVAALILAGSILAGLWTPRYQSKMEILVESRRSDPVVSSSTITPVQFSGNPVTEEDLNSEVELLKNDDLLRTVAQKAGLVPANSNGTIDEAAVALAARRIGRNLRVEGLRRTHLISVRYSSRNPQESAAVLRALAAAYIEKHTEVHRPTGEFKFFDQEALRFRGELTQAQNKLSEFSLTRGVISAQSERDAAMAQATAFESKAHEAEALASQTESRIRTLEAQLKTIQPRVVTSVRSTDNPELLGQLHSTLLNLQLKRSELLTKYAPSYPLVQEVEEQIAQTSAAIRGAQRSPMRDETTDQSPLYELVKGELARAQSDLSGIRASESAAATIAAQYRGAARKLNDDNVVQQNLMRDAKTKEDAYLLYVHKSEEAGISDALDRRGIVNVALAEKPAVPYQPLRSPLESLLITGGLMILGSFATAFTLDALDPTFRTPGELQAYLDAPVLAALPKE